MSLDDVTAIDLVGTNTAVVGSLGSGEPVLGPSEGVHVLVQEGVLLFDSEPGLLVLRKQYKISAQVPVCKEWPIAQEHAIQNDTPF